MTQEEGATLGAALSAAPHSSVEKRAWFVGERVPELDDDLTWKPNMWDPGKRVSMISVSFSREDAITNAVVDLAMSASGDPTPAPKRLFEFTVRLDAVLDISTADKLATYGLTIAEIASFHDIERGLQRLRTDDPSLRNRLKLLAETAREFRGTAKNGTRIEKVTALASAVSFDGMLVPGPWHGRKDLLVFYSGWPEHEFLAHDTFEDVEDLGVVSLQRSGAS